MATILSVWRMDLVAIIGSFPSSAVNMITAGNVPLLEHE